MRMPPNQGSGMPRLTFSIPANHQTALEYLTETRGKPGNRPAVAQLVREAVAEYLANQEDLPPEARDLLDEDLVANAGGTKEGESA